MPRAATARRSAPAAPAPTAAPTATSLIALLDSIERVGAASPGAIAFRAALAREGREAQAAGGPPALDALRREIRAADPAWAEAREQIITAAWTSLRPALVAASRG